MYVGFCAVAKNHLIIHLGFFFYMFKVLIGKKKNVILCRQNTKEVQMVSLPLQNELI